jgi:hypothetical protein
MINLDKPLIQATLSDLKEVLTVVLKDYELESEGKTRSAQKHLVYGIAGIAQLFGCSEPTAQRIKNSGEIDDAISQINGIIVCDAEYALDLLRVSKKYRNTSLRKSKK